MKSLKTIFLVLLISIAQPVKAECKLVFDGSASESGIDLEGPFASVLYAADPGKLVKPLPYDKITIPDLKQALKTAYRNVEKTFAAAVAKGSNANFADDIEPVLSALALYQHIRVNLEIYNVQMNSEETEAAMAEAMKLDTVVNLLRYQDEKFYWILVGVRDRKHFQTAVHEKVLTLWIEKSEAMGVSLGSAAKSQIVDIDSKLQSLAEQFRANNMKVLAQTISFDSTIEFEDGISQSFLAQAKARAATAGRDGYDFLLKPEGIDQWTSVLEYAKSPDVRKRFYEAYVNRAKGELDSSDLVTEMVNLRLYRARLLEKKNFAQTVLPSMMIGSAENLQAFADATRPRFKDMARDELAAIAQFKFEMTGDRQLNPWDVQYYGRKLEISRLNWDTSEANRFFEVNSTLPRVLEIYAEFYQIEFKVDEQAPRWHPDVFVYRVFSKRTGKDLGLIYFDLFERDGKPSTAYAEEIKAPGLYRSLSGTNYLQPGMALVNVGVPKNVDGPSFFSMKTLTSLVHELGHTLHSLSSTAPYPMYSNFRTPIDIVELPSQLLENLIYRPENLARIGRDFETGAPLPAEWIAKLAQSRTINIGIKSLARRGLMTQVDMSLHSIESPITGSLADFERQALSEWEEFPYLMDIAGTATTNTYLFAGHGYESRYHGYQYCEVLDFDAYEFSYDDDGNLKPDAGIRFWDIVMSPGALGEPAQNYREFRGQDPDPEAIIRKAK